MNSKKKWSFTGQKGERPFFILVSNEQAAIKSNHIFTEILETFRFPVLIYRFCIFIIERTAIWQKKGIVSL